MLICILEWGAEASLAQVLQGSRARCLSESDAVSMRNRARGRQGVLGTSVTAGFAI